MILYLVIWAFYGFPHIVAWNGWAVWLVIAVVLSRATCWLEKMVHKQDKQALTLALANEIAARRRRERRRY